MTLFEPWPGSVEYEGTVYPIYASFDRVLEAFSTYRRNDFSPAEKLDYVTFLLLGEDVPPNPGLLNAVFTALDTTGAEKKITGPRSFDFEQDAGAIRASFRAVYGMDLDEQRGRLHWCAFLDLFRHLPEDCAFGRIVRIRTCKVPPATSHNREQVQALLRAKAAVRLQIPEEERQVQFQHGLMGLARAMREMGEKRG